MNYTEVTRYVCECGLEVIARKTHDEWHKTNDERRRADIAEAEAKAARAQTPMGWLPENGQLLRSDGEWPR